MHSAIASIGLICGIYDPPRSGGTTAGQPDRHIDRTGWPQLGRIRNIAIGPH
jgi:hypothetical protein